MIIFMLVPYSGPRQPRCRQLTPTRSARSTFLRYIQQHPGRGHHDDERRAAVAHERENGPLRRQKTGHDRHINEPLEADEQRDAECQETAESVANGQRGPYPAPEYHAEQKKHNEPAEQAEFLADHGIDEVRVALRQEQEFLPSFSQAAAEHPPAAEREER